MKYNKGFAPIFLVAIIVGALIVGGGAYYVGTNKNVEKEKVEDVKNIENNETKKENIVEENNSSIEVTSLKKVEQLAIGSKYTIGYKTNLAPKDAIVFLFVGTGENNKWMKIVPSGNDDSFSVSSNSYIWTIPKEICGVEVCTSLIAGEKYKIKAILTGTINNQFQDVASYVSDSYFTVISTPKESTNNDAVNQPAYLKSVYVKNGKNYIDVDYIQMFATSEERIKAMIEDKECVNVKDCYDFPNGYKRNANPLIRTFEVSPSVLINVYGEYNQYLNNGDLDSSKSLITFSQLKDFSNKQVDYEQYIILDVKNDKVVKIIEPYQE